MCNLKAATECVRTYAEEPKRDFPVELFFAPSNRINYRKWTTFSKFKTGLLGIGQHGSENQATSFCFHFQPL